MSKKGNRKSPIKIMQGILWALLPFVFSLLVLLYLYHKVPLEMKADNQPVFDKTVGNILLNKSIEQTFTSKYNGLQGVSVLFSTYAIINKSSLSVTLLDDHGNVAVNQTLDCSKLTDNTSYTIPFSPIKSSKDRAYTLKITPLSVIAGNSVSVYTGPADPKGELVIDGSKANSDLTISTYYASSREKLLFEGPHRLQLIIICVCAVIAVLLFGFALKYFLRMNTDMKLKN